MADGFILTQPSETQGNLIHYIHIGMTNKIGGGCTLGSKLGNSLGVLSTRRPALGHFGAVPYTKDFDRCRKTDSC